MVDNKELRLICRLIALVRQDRYQPQGMDLLDINLEYHHMYGQYVTPNDFDCKSMYELCRSLDKKSMYSLSVTEVQHNGYQTDRLLFDEKAYDKWINDLKCLSKLESLETVVEPVVAQDVGSQVTINWSICTEPIMAIKDVENLYCFSAKITYISSPSEFYIHLKNNKQSYIDLRRSMRCYESNNCQYFVPKELLVIGYLVAVKNPMDWDVWHRAVIRYINEDVITLYAIDFGNIIVESRSELRLLKESMLLYPVLAIKVSLSGIAPLNGKYWSSDAIDYLQSLKKTFNDECDWNCIFIDGLYYNYYSVVFVKMVSTTIEDNTMQLPVYLHENFIRKSLARMISFCWHQYYYEMSRDMTTGGHDFPEPLHVVKRMPGIYAIKSPPIALSETNMWPMILPKSQSSEQIDFNDVQSNSDNNSDDYDYSNFYLTSYPSIEVKVKSYFEKFDDFPYVERSYFTDGHFQVQLPYYERKYFIQCL